MYSHSRGRSNEKYSRLTEPEMEDLDAEAEEKRDSVALNVEDIPPRPVGKNGDIGLANKASRSPHYGSLFSIAESVNSRRESVAAWKPSEGKAPDGKQLADTYQAALVHGLARGLIQYGAPNYRVEVRVQDAAEALGVPASLVCFPNAMLISVGDATPQHPTRTFFLKIPTGFDIGKLHDVDALAKKCCEISLRNVGNHTKLPSAPVNYSSKSGDLDIDPPQVTPTTAAKSLSNDEDMLKGLLETLDEIVARPTWRPILR
ncbi:hypothetical protein HDU76_011224, partial [Blyttiomyces sp. JEL0837]